MGVPAAAILLLRHCASSGTPRHDVAAGPGWHPTSDRWWRAMTLSSHVTRRLACGLIVAAFAAGAGRASAEAGTTAWDALRAGGIVLFRHAIAPGGGDPVGMEIGACATQRNLDTTGRAQARRIGDAVRAEGVAIAAVMASEWCRTTETAELAFPGRVEPQPLFNSFFATPGDGPARTAAARRLLLDRSGPGALVVVTHQVNITALTGIVPASGEGVVLRREGDRLVVVGRVRP
jgi:phosphohistidine phosphatase SixA